ncbi:nitronate monooxygenase [Shimia sp. SDUM112013]|uniref:NAD(P)H-dependent flavin oxidoreductase n=1 Tax=Shimia sp. SDUM112013 TaxID=3136160 RepID=UPI0032EE1632
MTHWLFQQLGVKHPVIQAPMAGVSTPDMAAAVSDAGGLGSLGLGASTVAAARAMIAETRRLTDHSFNVNLFCHLPASRDPAREAAWLAAMAPEFARFGAAPPEALHEIYESFQTNDAMLEMLLEERPAVVSFHFGLPAPEKIVALRDAGCVLLASATSLDEARAIAAAGIDAIVAQGIEAGGHRGVFDPGAPDAALSTADLVHLLVGQVPCPVIAAGGIMSGGDIRRMLDLGAVAAQLGTAFVACDESAADAAYRAALVDPAVNPSVLTPALSGRPARCLQNRFVRWSETARVPVPSYPVAYDAAKALAAASHAAGEVGYGAQWAGTGAMQARAVPASDIMAGLVAEMTA